MYLNYKMLTLSFRFLYKHIEKSKYGGIYKKLIHK